MGQLLRSEEMNLVQLFVQVEAAHDTIDELGELGLIQFNDLNPEVNAFQRHFVREVKRAAEMERKLKFFEEEIEKEEFDDTLEYVKYDRGLLASTRASVRISPGAINTAAIVDMDELEAKFEDLEKELLQMNSNQELLHRNHNELVELKHVLTKDAQFFAGTDSFFTESPEGSFSLSDLESPLIPTENFSGKMAQVRLGHVTGVIERSKVPIFERVLWRVTRGNLYMKRAEIEEPIFDPKTGEPGEKDVFIVFFQGERAETKIRKICESFGASLYPCGESPQERKEMEKQVVSRLEDLANVIEHSMEHRKRMLLDLSVNLEEWKTRVVKEKAIYHTMNLFDYDVGRRCLIAEGWCPKGATEQVQEALRRADDRSGALAPAILTIVKSKAAPPTYFKTDKFTSSFQGIVDAYGMARYREINPGVFTIISFPFLFGMMFGDIGHGILMMIFALYLCIYEDSLGKKKLNEMVQTCFNGRYLLLIMSIFAIYCGALYNECFAVTTNLFGSRWAFYDNEEYARDTNPAFAYPFGVDPAWKGAKNELTFYNSLKMKLSIIFGVSQMVFGILLSSLNGVYFKKPYNIWFEFVPQLGFMMSIFGYMCALVVIKWCTDWSSTPAPGLLNLLINMFLKPYELAEEDRLYTGQKYVQWGLLLVAVISVPMMLFPKPLLLRRDHRRKYQRIKSHEENDIPDGADEEEFEFGEVMIHQIIHTIEFVLGAISNTASYLRLWALSLAHSELATVFWERVFVLMLRKDMTGQFILIFAGWAVWAGMTFGVLLVMEALSAFLHALRLHWVEFQNKFYMGDGYKFVPFAYSRLLSDEED